MKIKKLLLYTLMISLAGNTFISARYTPQDFAYTRNRGCYFIPTLTGATIGGIIGGHTYIQSIKKAKKSGKVNQSISDHTQKNEESFNKLTLVWAIITGALAGVITVEAMQCFGGIFKKKREIDTVFVVLSVSESLGLDQKRDTFTPYEVLGVSENASAQEIKEARDKLIEKHDPNKIPDTTSGMGGLLRLTAEETVNTVNKAFDTINQSV